VFAILGQDGYKVCEVGGVGVYIVHGNLECDMTFTYADSLHTAEVKLELRYQNSTHETKMLTVANRWL